MGYLRGVSQIALSELGDGIPASQTHGSTRATHPYFGLKAAAAAEVHRAACWPLETRRQHRVHSGNPAVRRPSISSFVFDCPPRAIYADIVKPGSSSSRC